MRSFNERMTRLSGARARQRGSVILLVVTALVLSMLLGLAYMNTARQDRRSTRTASVARDIDQIEQSVLSEIQNVLREDLGFVEENVLDSDGEPTDETYAIFFEARGDQREPFVDGLRPPFDYAGETAGFSPWLASTSPVSYRNLDDPNARDTPTLEWPQITRLTDGYVDRDGQVSDTLQHRMQVSIISDHDLSGQFGASGQVYHPSDPRLLGLEHGADATGDGIIDSRWERSPLFSINGVDYYMAVRIEDNSARLNVNTAFSQVDDIGQYPGTEAQGPRWEHASEADLGSLVHRYGMLADDPTLYTRYMQEEVPQFLEWRTDDDWPIVPEMYNRDYWQEYYGNVRTSSVPQVAMDSEFSLRYRGGLNSRSLESQLESEDNGMPVLLRHYPEADFENGRYLTEVLWEDAYENMLVDLTPAYSDSDNYTNPRNEVPLADYYEMNARGQLTTVSGASQRFTPDGDKLDIKTILQDEDLDVLSNRVIRAWFTDLDRGDTAIPVGFNDMGLAAPEQRIHAFAYQYAVNALAYSQGETSVGMPRIEREIDGTEVRFYGHVPLPFIGEVYSQRKYEVTDVDDTTDPNNPMATWEAVGDAGYVVEIRNPYKRPIDLRTVRLRVADNDWGTLDELASQTYLQPGDVLLLYRNSDVGGTSEPQDDVQALFDGNVEGTQVDVEIDEDWRVADEEVQVELLAVVRDVGDISDPEAETVAMQAVDQNGDPVLDGDGNPVEQYWLKYQIVDYAKAHPDEFAEVRYDPGLLPEVGDIAWEQQTTIGDARGLNIMTVMGDDYMPEHKPIDEEPEHDADIVALGIRDKRDETPAGGPTGAIAVDLDRQQFVFPETDERIRSVGELALVTVLAPGRGTSEAERTFAGQWEFAGTAERVEDFMLDMGQNHLGDDVTWSDGTVPELHPQHNVPHAMVLMDAFTAHRHFEDGDRPDHGRFAPGTININTASRELLLAALPVPWDDASASQREMREQTRRDIVDAILRYRDNLAADTADSMRPDSGTEWRQEPGIAHIGEIYAATWHLFGDNDEDDDVLGNTPIDRLGNPAADTADEVIDDMEEKTLVLRMLSQMLTTRSDVYTAHILIRGYPTGQTDVPLVERRLMAVFDRSNVFDTGGQGTPRILGIYRY